MSINATAPKDRRPFFDPYNVHDCIGVFVLYGLLYLFVVGVPVTLWDLGFAPWPGLASLLLAGFQTFGWWHSARKRCAPPEPLQPAAS